MRFTTPRPFLRVSAYAGFAWRVDICEAFKRLIDCADKLGMPRVSNEFAAMADTFTHTTLRRENDGDVGMRGDILQKTCRLTILPALQETFARAVDDYLQCNNNNNVLADFTYEYAVVVAVLSRDWTAYVYEGGCRPWRKGIDRTTAMIVEAWCA